ncbi:MAG: hypothetical protein LPK85_14325, partial [Gammaproteobacteria bacterium]|nr:hypothetical protein [Gammaproteobacteria bacterium]
GANYPADIGLVGDAPAIVAALLSRLPARPPRTEVSERIARLKAQFQDRSASPHKRGRVNPARFLARLRAHTAADALMVLDDGNHTFLAAEHWSVLAGGVWAYCAASSTTANCRRSPRRRPSPTTARSVPSCRRWI